MNENKSKLIAKLYRHAALAEEIDFKTLAFEQLREILPFDCATWIDCAQFEDDEIRIFEFFPFCVNPRLEQDIRASLYQNKIAKTVMRNKGLARIGHIDRINP